MHTPKKITPITIWKQKHHILAIIVWGNFGTVLFLTVLFLASVHQGILLDINFYFIVETIMQLLSQGSVNYLLQVYAKKAK